MFAYSSRGGRKRSGSFAAQTANSLEYAVQQDLKTIVLPLYIAKLLEDQETKEATAFSCFTHVFQSTQLALLLRYPEHWRPYGTKALYGCIPIRCSQGAFVQWIYSTVSQRIIAVFDLHSREFDTQSLISNESFWCEISLYVFTLYALYEIATVAPRPPFDGQSTNNGEDHRDAEEKRLRSCLPMGVQSNENPKILYRRSFPESNRIRCTIELYSTLLQLQHTCYMFGPLSMASMPYHHQLPQWIADDLMEIVHCLLNPRDNRLEFCAYVGPCSLEGFASSCENQISKPVPSESLVYTGIAVPDAVNIDSCHLHAREPDAATGTVDNTPETNGDTDDSSVSLQNLLQKYIGLRHQCHFDAPTVAAASNSVRINAMPRRRVRARIAYRQQGLPSKVETRVPTVTTAADPIVQLLRLCSNRPVQQLPVDTQHLTADALPSDETDNDDDDDDDDDKKLKHTNKSPVNATQDDEQSMVSTWTNGTDVGAGQNALRQLLSKVVPASTTLKTSPRRSIVTTKNSPEGYGDFFLENGKSSCYANGSFPHSGNGKRTAKNGAKRLESDAEQCDASVTSLLSFWLEPDTGQHSLAKTNLCDNDSASSNSCSSSSSNVDDTVNSRHHPTAGQMALSTLLSLAGVGNREESEDEEGYLEI